MSIRPKLSNGPKAIASAPYVEQVSYTHQHLDVVGKSLSYLLNDKNFKTILITELDKIKSEEKQVTISHLIDACKVKGFDLVDQMSRVTNKVNYGNNITVSLDAFNKIDNVDWKIKLYIPSYDKLRKEGKITDDKYVVFSYAGEEGIVNSSYGGYRYKDKDKFEQIKVDENYSNNNPVIIISLDEKLNRDSENYQDVGVKKNISNRPNGTSVNAGFGLMAIKEHREDWAAGESDVAMVGTVTWGNSTHTNPFNPPAPDNVYNIWPVGFGAMTSYDHGGVEIRGYSRKEVDKQTWVNVNSVIVNGWNPYWYPSPGYKNSYDRAGDYAFFAVYEADPWPAASRTAPFITGINVQYRSTDVYYNSEIITANNTVRVNSDNPWESTGDFGNPFYYLGHQVYTGGIMYQIGDWR